MEFSISDAIYRKIQLSITPEPKEEPVEQSEKRNEALKVSQRIVRTKSIHFPPGVL